MISRFAIVKFIFACFCIFAQKNALHFGRACEVMILSVWNNGMTTPTDRAEDQSKSQIERMEKLIAELQEQNKEAKKSAKSSYLIALSTLVVALLTLIATALTLFLK